MPEKSQKIFQNDELSTLAVRWKELTNSGKHDEAMELLELIVRGSTEMFERFAQHEKFHYTVDLPTLVAAAHEKIVRWLLAWDPKKGTLFSWFTKCAKNVFRSETTKVSAYRKKFHITGDSLEQFFGQEDHEVNKHDAAAAVYEKLQTLTCRWGAPQEIGAFRYLVECIVSQGHDKQRAIDGAAYCYGISPELSKFFYGSALIALREQFIDITYIPRTTEDLFRQEYSHTNLIDLIDIVGWKVASERLFPIMGGQRIKLPTTTQIARLREDYAMMREVEQTDFDPNSVERVARKYRRSPESASEVFDRMSVVLDKNRSGEYDVFGPPHH